MGCDNIKIKELSKVQKDIQKNEEDNRSEISDESTSFDYKNIKLINENNYNHNNDEIFKMYDAIFKCESINELYESGWQYSVNDTFVKRFQKKDDSKKFCPLCILGETNKGKTYILNLLTNNKLKSGIEYKTVGLSCKFTDLYYSDNEITKYDQNNEHKFLIFDSAGRSEPLLIDPEEKRKFNDEALKRRVQTDNRDLKLSEEFMKNLLIKNSRIILVVVNQLSLSEQLFLYELKNDANFEELYVIHNLFNFKQKEEMEEYINNTIIHSIYFDIIKDYYQLDDEEENDINKPFYFFEEQEKNGREQSIITHLILGDIETKDPWIKNFNEKTIDFLKTKMLNCLAKDFFSVEKIIEKELLNENIIDEKSKLIIEKNDKPIEGIGKDKFILKIVNKENKDNRENILKKKEDDFTESREFNIMGYTPDYIFYKDEKNSEFIIEIECAGIRDDNIQIKGKTIKGKTFFLIEGRKIFPKQLHLKNKPFSIYFSVHTEKENIKIDTSDKINDIKPTYVNGIYRKAFPMTKDVKNIKLPNYNKIENNECFIF